MVNVKGSSKTLVSSVSLNIDLKICDGFGDILIRSVHWFSTRCILCYGIIITVHDIRQSNQFKVLTMFCVF